MNSVAVNSSPKKTSLDREKTCPLLLRVFCKIGGHNRPQDYRGNHGPSGDIIIYTWRDATLKELAILVKDTNPAARKKETKFSFCLVYPDIRGRYLFREIGSTVNGKRGDDDHKTLDECGFHIGDFIEVAIFLPRG
eukprot:Sdes_comp21521_c0_seq1m20137